MRSAPRKAYLALLVVVGLIGAAGLGIALGQRPFAQPASVMLAFCALGAVTRVLAFPLYRGRVIAFDSAYFIAAGVVLGWAPAGLVVVVTLAIDMAVQGLRVRLFDLDPLPRRERLAQALYATFGNAGLLLLAGLLLDQLGLAPDRVNRHMAVFYSTPVALLFFVAGHYHIAFVAAVFNGDPPGRAYRQLVLNGMLGESLLTPLAMVMVLVYQVSDPAPFVLLAATVLVINAGFFIAARYAQRLNDRVRDLTILNAVHRALSRNLELELLLSTLATQLVQHVPNLGRVLVGVRDISSGALDVHAFTAEGRLLFEKPVPAREGLLGRVVDERRLLLLDGRPLRSAGEDPDLLAPDTRAWLGVPLIIHDEVLGVLCLQSPQVGTFRRQHELLLVPLAAQAAIAIENARLFRLATVDGLTGLFVRRYFDQRLEDECHRSQRFGTRFSLLMMDLDDFKFVNDTRGHVAGDRVLRETAMVLRRALRSVDIAARYGGEEFTVLLPRAELDTAQQVAERIRSSVASHPVTGVTGTLYVTLSVGVASYPRDALDPSMLVKAADRALYEAKRRGKNQVVCAQDPALLVDAIEP
ncbi:MAG: sensor domain-containing diguanylate cyclase [Pseudomonadota bacterium]